MEFRGARNSFRFNSVSSGSWFCLLRRPDIPSSMCTYLATSLYLTYTCILIAHVDKQDCAQAKHALIQATYIATCRRVHITTGTITPPDVGRFVAEDADPWRRVVDVVVLIGHLRLVGGLQLLLLLARVVPTHVRLHYARFNYIDSTSSVILFTATKLTYVRVL